MLKIQIIKSLKSVKESDWQSLAPAEFPFMSYAFLGALEFTGCLGARTGWQPHFLTVWQGERLLGAMISYLRNNSFGEYIFDFGWANAYAQLGYNYYPKLMTAVPFTPAVGRKILVRADLSSEIRKEVSDLLLATMKELTQTMNLSSAHALYIPEEEISEFQSRDFLIRHSYQYHWKNLGYQNFQEFLLKLRSKRRKEIQRERAQVQESQVKISRLTGDQLESRHALIMYDFYMSTMEKKSGFDFLTLEFFERVFASMKNQILFVMAEDESGRPVAGALNYYGPRALYGRHWGCLAEYRALHFELCYYQGIEFAIEKGLELFEGGAQGEHKFNRGFMPCSTYSAHFIKEPGISQIIARSLLHEKREIEQLQLDADEHTPYSRAKHQ